MINNKKYWDNRFKSGDWELNKGNEQTLFHYNILLEHMPEWLKNEISDNNFNICDLGCGMGEGVDLFKKYFKKSEIIGVDFSDYAIEKAKKVYPDNSFIRSDITNFNNHYDVIISSHTLEHFENPFELLSHMISLADKYFILIIPFQEKDLHKEHFYSFDYNFFPINVQNHKLVHYKEIDRLFFDAGGYWGKEQLILIYANTQNVDTGKFTLEQLNNNYFGEFKLQKQIYKNKITEYEKKLDSVIQEHEEKLNTQRKEYENEFVEYKKIFDVQTEHIDKLDSKIQNYEEKLNTQREEYENNLLDIQTHADELNKLNKKYLSQFLSEQKKCKKLINTNKNLEFDLFNAKKMALMFSKLSEKYSSQFLSEQKKYESLKKQNNRLNNLLKAYKSRKVVRTADSILKTYKSTKYRFKLNFNRKTDSVSILSKIKPKKIKDIKVAVILDEFSYNCFKHEFNAIPIEPSNWLEVFETKKPDLFFCESAWTGTNPEIKPWQGKIYSSINFNQENRKILLSILEYCKKHNIPTIFWNKEDPTHYDDKVCNFVDTALKFDHIFTTAEECVQKYKKDYGHKSVHCLMFGAQPKLFNPITKQNRSNEVIFAGSWYGDIHIQRSKEMIKIFDNILNSGYSLKIYDRTYTPNNPNSNFPKKYLKYVNPAVPFDQIENVYKESRYALNINTETKSKTMFARRVFELMLCNTLVLSNYSKGMDELFGNDIIFVGGEKINLSFCEEKRSNNLYNVLRNHTYSQRFKQILDTIDYKYLPTDDNVTVYYVVNDQSEIKDILKHYESITYVNKRLTLLLSKNIPNHLIKNISKKYTNPEISVYSLINLKNKNEIISNKTPYFIFANTQLKKDFIEKGILHYSYIETNFGIALGEKFTFKKAKDINNIIFHNKKFMDVFNSIFKETSIEFTVYTLQEYKHEIYRKLKSKTSEISKIDINIPDIDIHGSCVSRDVFNFDKNKEIKIGQYFARQSFVSAVSSPFIGKINVNLPSVFQKRMIESDLRKDMFEKLSLNKANYLMIDLIDERLHLIKYNNSLFTFSDELRISKFMEDFDVEVVNKLSMDNYIWKNAMDEYIDCLLKIYAEDKIIIHESYLVESYITLDGGKKYFPEEKRRYIKLLNKFFKKYYVYLKQKLPNAHVISILGDNYCSWEGHLWDKAPMHYESRYYQDVLKIIKNIIFEEKDKPISINKSTLKKLKT